MWIWVTRIIAILGGALTVLAAFELIFATRSAPAIAATIDICAMGTSRQDRLDMMHALASAEGDFVFVELELVQYPLSCRDPADFGSELGFDLTLIALDDGGVNNRPERLQSENFVWAALSPSSIPDNTLTRTTHEWAEDPGYITVNGLFSVSGRRAEGDYEFDLSPAPFDSTTQALADCSRAIAGRTGIDRLRHYVTGCMM